MITLQRTNMRRGNLLRKLRRVRSRSADVPTQRGKQEEQHDRRNSREHSTTGRFLFEISSERRRRPVFQCRITENSSKRPNLAQLFRTSRTALKVRFHFRRAHEIQLVGRVGIEKVSSGFAVHSKTSPRYAASNSFNLSRARESRDITVPIGTPITAATSLYESPSISRSTTASRNSSGSDSIARRT